MLETAASAAVLVAMVAWVVAAISLIRILLLVPHGKRWKAITASGFWQFEQVRKLGGPRVDGHLQRYMWAFAVFFLAIVGSMFFGIMLSIQANDAAQSAASIHSLMPSASLES